jgi:hypothetical protein
VKTVSGEGREENERSNRRNRVKRKDIAANLFQQMANELTTRQIVCDSKQEWKDQLAGKVKIV